MQPDPRFDLQLEGDLAAAGAIARSAVDQAPMPAFASGLRSRLLTEHALQSARPAPPRRSPIARFAPVFAAVLALVLATAVAAGALRIFGPGPSAPAEPQRTPYQIPAGLIGGDSWTPTPTPTSSPSPTPTPTESPTPTPEPIAEPIPEPTPAPTPPPAPVPTPEPTPTIGELTLGLIGCDGGVVIGWSPISHPSFAKYRTLRSTSADIPVAYPPQGGAVEVMTAKAASPAAASGFDSSAVPGVTYFYRTLALDGAGAVIASSGVASGAAQSVQGLGPLTVSADPGGTRFTWAPFTGSGACFTYYKLVYTLDGSPPAYLDGHAYLAAIGDQAQGSYVSPDLVSGQTYTLRLQALRATDTGAFLVAQTDVATYTAP